MKWNFYPNCLKIPNNLVFYFFDINTLKTKINIFKTIKDKNLTPFKILKIILTNQVHFNKSMALQVLKNPNKTISINVKNHKKVKYKNSMPSFFDAEYHLYDVDDWSGHIPFEVGNDFLVITCKTENKNIIISAMPYLKDELRKIFIKGMSQWSAYLHNLDEIVTL